MKAAGKNIISNIESVERFAFILNFELGTSVLLFLQGNVWIALPLIIIAAVIFTPYMLYILTIERRFNWIIIFIIIVILPFILFYFFSKDSYALEAFLLIPFIFFYFYCLLLRLSVNQWIKDYNWHTYYEEQKKESISRKNDLY